MVSSRLAEAMDLLGAPPAELQANVVSRNDDRRREDASTGRLDFHVITTRGHVVDLETPVGVRPLLLPHAS
jgi:hypothetical protein